MQDAWRAYLEMALGLTEAPRKKAQKVAGDLVNRGGATAAQLQGLVEDLMSTGMANREALTNIVRYEVDRALGVVGLATAEEVADLTTRVRDLERQLRAARATAAPSSGDLIATEAAGADGGIGGDRLNQPAPLPVKATKKTVAKKPVKARPNAMPKAATPPPPAKKVTGPAAPSAPAGTGESPVAPVKDAAAATELPPTAGTTSSAPAKKAAAKKAAVAKKAAPAKKTIAKKTTPGPIPGTTLPEA
jgi:polyhydroxyalkanoate synthesis regulator phasin